MADLIETLARAICNEHARTELGYEVSDEFWNHIVARWRLNPSAAHNEHVQCYFADAGAALAAHEAWLKAAGMTVVPVEPTQAMKDAAVDWCPLITKEVWPDGSPRGIRGSLNDEECGEMYRAMLSACGVKEKEESV